MHSAFVVIPLALGILAAPASGFAREAPYVQKVDSYYPKYREHRGYRDPRREELQRIDYEIQEAREHHAWHRVHELEGRREHLIRELRHEHDRY